MPEARLPSGRFPPGVSGNPGGKPGSLGRMRGLMAETLEMSREQVIQAFCARWRSPKTVQDMAEFYARLGGELTKEVGESSGGIAVVVIKADGPHALDPELFRAVAAKRLNGSG